MTHDVYLLYRLFKDSSTKSYGEEKPNRYSTNNMYGRAEFDLLKLRVLYQSKNNQERKNKYKSSQAQPADHLKKRRRMKNGTNPRGIIAGISKGA